ncbi:MAG: phosphotransferase [Actinomycetota bacterium]
MNAPAPRHVTLVLCRRDGDVLGRLDPFEVESPWWMEVEPVVDACVARHGVRPVVLRLLDAVSRPHGGAVTYLAEVDQVPGSLHPWDGQLRDHPLRAPYARPGGPAADLAWAADALAATGRRPTADPRQIRTWNLSSLWRLPTDAGPVWLKCVPSFFAHEAAVMEVLADQAVPPLVDGEPGRSLLDHVEGVDGYDADVAGWRTHVDTLVGIQLAAVERPDELTASGVPARSLAELVGRLREVVARWAPELEPAVVDRLGAVLDRADSVIDLVLELAPITTLVHGDAHPGNGRFHGGRVTILDWGDSFVGHPLLDLSVGEAYHAELAPAVVDLWLERWRHAGLARVDEAWDALRPLAHLRTAAVFQDFFDGIEPDERRYHEHDLVPELVRAANG